MTTNVLEKRNVLFLVKIGYDVIICASSRRLCIQMKVEINKDEKF